MSLMDILFTCLWQFCIILKYIFSDFYYEKCICKTCVLKTLFLQILKMAIICNVASNNFFLNIKILRNVTFIQILLF